MLRKKNLKVDIFSSRIISYNPTPAIVIVSPAE